MASVLLDSCGPRVSQLPNVPLHNEKISTLGISDN